MIAMAVEWRPCGLLNGQAANPYALLVLNQPLNRNALSAVIDKASLLVCADAGADRFLQYERSLHNGLKSRVPDAIVGDLDSLTLDTEKHYRENGVQVVKDPDQYSSDLTKCLKWIRDAWEQQNGKETELDVVVLGGLGGRVDQGFSQIHHLYMASGDASLVRGRVYLLSESSLSFVLGTGKNVIHIEDSYFTENVGIIPIQGPSKITTSGLEWDVKAWPTSFGGQVSTSNHVRAKQVVIEFDGPRPLFTIELAARLAAAHPR